jgi:hypothetical protein
MTKRAKTELDKIAAELRQRLSAETTKSGILADF